MARSTMLSAAAAADEPVTPGGRLFLQPSLDQVIHAVFGAKNPIDIEALKHEIDCTYVKQCPRFSSLLVRDKRGREYWRRVDRVDMDEHVFEVEEEGEGPGFVNEYVASLTVSVPLDAGKPLWEVHVLPRNRCYVMRIHHALGDGVSLVSALLSRARRVDDPRLPPTIRGKAGAREAARGSTAAAVLRRLALMAWYTAVYVVEMVLRMLWIKDETSPMSGGEGVELWPRKLEVAIFDLHDMKTVKNAVGATINDVLLAVIESGFAKYLELRSPELRRPPRISALVMVNTRQEPGLQELSRMMASDSRARWGNQIGCVVLPVNLERRSSGDRGDPLEHVRRAKATMDKKKLSLEARFPYAVISLLMSLFGPKVVTAMNYRLASNTTFLVSNVVGPLEEISFAGNPITHFMITCCGSPQAIMLHMVSYKGKGSLQILVAKDIIPDSDVLKKCFEDALDDMKNSALLHNSRKNEG